MYRFGSYLVGLTLIPFATGLGAQPTAQPAAPATATDGAGAAGEAGDPIVCRSLTISGSRMRQRVCDTRSGWENRSKDASRALQDGQDAASRRPIGDPDRF